MRAPSTPLGMTNRGSGRLRCNAARVPTASTAPTTPASKPRPSHGERCRRPFIATIVHGWTRLQPRRRRWMRTALPAAPAESARCPVVARRDGASPVRPLHDWLESGPPVEPQGERVFRLHAELDLSLIHI